jgi:hypothetical protein
MYESEDIVGLFYRDLKGSARSAESSIVRASRVQVAATGLAITIYTPETIAFSINDRRIPA